MNNKKTSIKALVFGSMAAIVMIFAFAACNPEDTDFGRDLTDPSAWYNGTLCDTLSIEAYTCREDSMTTSNYLNGVIGMLQN